GRSEWTTSISFGERSSFNDAKPVGVPSRLSETCDETISYRVIDTAHYNGNDGAGTLRRTRRCNGADDDDPRILLHQLPGVIWKSFVISLCKARFQNIVAGLEQSILSKTLPQCF